MLNTEKEPFANSERHIAIFINYQDTPIVLFAQTHNQRQVETIYDKSVLIILSMDLYIHTIHKHNVHIPGYKR